MYELQKKEKTIGGNISVYKNYLTNAVLHKKLGISHRRLARFRNEQEKLIFTYSLNDNHTQKLAA